MKNTAIDILIGLAFLAAIFGGTALAIHYKWVTFALMTIALCFALGRGIRERREYMRMIRKQGKQGSNER